MLVAEISPTAIDSARYAKCIEVSKRIRWDIDRDVIRGRSFDFRKRFLPDGLSRISSLEFLRPYEQRLLSQIQGRTYANMLGLVERFIGAKMLEISRDHRFGDQVALEALVRFTDEELKHQAPFRRVERMIAYVMPESYEFVHEPNVVAGAVLAACNWAVLALTCHIELFPQVHYLKSQDDSELCVLYRDVFLFHRREESQHAILAELEWQRENARLTPEQRDGAVEELIALIAAVDGIVQAQASADASYFLRICGRALSGAETRTLAKELLGAYRWQYIVSGACDAHFSETLGSMITSGQRRRIWSALAPLMD